MKDARDGKAAAGSGLFSLEIVPDEARSLELRGNIFEVMNRKTEAIADYRKALSLDPHLKESAEGLKRLGATL
jgi:predicted negative regulator of RcsB-dependent stress response